ncbi:MAG TPA: hypothetical protein VMS83_09365 [Methanoregula sp.]|nr:hypothetical protein [Methanoregula sp.]
MAGPYLKSGESIVLTTDRVLIDDTEYDLILTTQRLALVDSGHTSDQPQVVPFATIISVKGGSTPAREPVITLTITDPAVSDDTRTLDLIFSQQPYQDRSAECDLWVRKLIEHIVSVRQEPVSAGKQPAAGTSRGMNPSVRRFIAPDVPLPHTEVAENRKPSEELLRAIQGTDWESGNTGVDAQTAEEPEVPEPTVVPTPEEERLPPSPPPEQGDSLAAADAALQIPGVMEREPAATANTGALPSDEPAPDRENLPAEEFGEPTTVPATPFKELVPEESGTVREVPSIPPPEETKIGPAIDLEELSRQIEQIVPLRPEEAGGPGPEAGEPVGIPESVIFPVLTGEASDTGHPATTPPIPPERGEPASGKPPRMPKRRPPATVAAIAIVLLVIIGGITLVLLLPAWENQAGSEYSPATPGVTLQPVTTATPITIPPGGVWVKVSYNGTYYGKYGNPGSLIEVRGTGEQVYPVKNSNDLVEASFRKLDYSGDNMTVEIYNNGEMVKQAFKTSPAGEIDLLVNSTTGKPPFVPVTTTGA